ncbi:hypothetical protein C8J57DRAFT_1221593 [Mycena rebaudengoi]|nr:hypothetical protein C8J57DRAFT_1221593 [Mycena rebaudengoi]
MLYSWSTCTPAAFIWRVKYAKNLRKERRNTKVFDEAGTNFSIQDGMIGSLLSKNLVTTSCKMPKGSARDRDRLAKDHLVNINNEVIHCMVVVPLDTGAWGIGNEAAVVLPRLSYGWLSSEPSREKASRAIFKRLASKASAWLPA